MTMMTPTHVLLTTLVVPRICSLLGALQHLDHLVNRDVLVVHSLVNAVNLSLEFGAVGGNRETGFLVRLGGEVHEMWMNLEAGIVDFDAVHCVCFVQHRQAGGDDEIWELGTKIVITCFATPSRK